MRLTVGAAIKGKQSKPRRRAKKFKRLADIGTQSVLEKKGSSPALLLVVKMDAVNFNCHPGQCRVCPAKIKDYFAARCCMTLCNAACCSGVVAYGASCDGSAGCCPLFAAA